MIPIAEKVAREFSRRLTADLGADAMRTVVERNRAESCAHVCHSHDVCDPNETMADAIVAICGADALTVDSDVWSTAWELAVAHEFWATEAAQ